MAECHAGDLTRRASVWLALAVATVSILSACGSGATSSSPPAAKTPRTLTNVSLAITGGGSTKLVSDVASAERYFNKEGLNVTVSSLSTSLAIEAVESGTVNFVLGGATTANVAAIKGGSARVLSVIAHKESFVVVARKGITKVSQLEGKTVAGSGVTSANNTLFENMLAKQHIPASKVSILNQGGGSQGQVSLLLAGKVDAAVIDYAYYVNLPSGYNVVYNFATSPFQGMYDAVITSSKYASTHKSLTSAMITSLTEAARFIKSHKSVLSALIASDFSVSKANAPKVWAVLQSIYSSEPKASQSLIKTQIQQDKQTASVSDVKASKLFDWSYIPQSLIQNG
jgi:ABC-type nitrate/sulfonate/bicarbonate transport system substrate-binding protein